MRISVIILMAFLINTYPANLNRDLLFSRQLLAGEESLDAYQRYWRAYESYEARKIQDLSSGLEKGLQKLQQAYDNRKNKISQNQADAINSAIKEYEDQLANFPDSENRPHVMLNLALALNRSAEYLSDKSVELAKSRKLQALTILAKLNEKYPQFVKNDEATYLRALILDGLGQSESAYRVWRRLATSSTDSYYTIYSSIAVGDYLFEKENAREAYDFFENSMRILKKLPDYDEVLAQRINYRIAWAAYRSAKLKKSVEASLQLITPLSAQMSLGADQKFKADAVDLLGDALYEIDDRKYTLDLLQGSLDHDNASAVVLSILKRYLAANLTSEIIDLGRIAVNKYPSSLYAPDILFILADAYRDAGDHGNQVTALEKIAMMMPKKSLWRMRFKLHKQHLSQLDKKGLPAMELLATKFYERGIKAASPYDFEKASAYYGMLIDIKPHHENANYWRLRQANSLYFMNDYEDAWHSYEHIISGRKVSEDILEMAMYQKIYVNEKILLGAIKNQGKNGSLAQNPIVIEKLRKLEKSIEEFANRFPKASSVEEVLLLAASINRDMNRYGEASRYWRRVLLSKPSADQRRLAIRGLVLSEIKNSSPYDVITMVKRFLTLENWNKLGDSLRNELLGTLRSSTLKYAVSLERQGKLRQAAVIMVSVAEEFADLPDRGTLYRDAGYYYAMNGDWSDSLKICGLYEKHQISGYKGDMAYLKARSQEYLLDFKDSAQSYHNLVVVDPDHERASWALEQSLRIADSVGNKKLAGQASTLIAERSKKATRKVEYYLKAASFFEDGSEYALALSAAKKAQLTAKRLEDKYQARIKKAEIDYKSGNARSALTSTRKLIGTVKRDQDKIDRVVFLDVMGRCYSLLSAESLDKLERFRISDQSSRLLDAANQKLKYYEEYSSIQDELIGLDEYFAAKARYEMAEQAEKIATSINRIISDNSKEVDSPSRSSLQSQGKRLQKLAKSLHVENINTKLASMNNSRARYWIRRSLAKISGVGQTLRDSANEIYQLPTALSSDIANRWSID